MKYGHRAYIAKHSGGLKEMLETEKHIPLETAKILINSGLYEYYTYDDRIGAHRYIIKDLNKNYNLSTWINIYDKKI